MCIKTVKSRKLEDPQRYVNEVFKRQCRRGEVTSREGQVCLCVPGL